MASKNKITEMIAAIKTIYPYYAKEADVATLVKTWAILLKDFPDEAVNVAFYKCLQTCKMPPTPADVIEQLDEMARATEPSDEELWDEYRTALRKAGRLIYNFRFNAIASNGLTQGENARRQFTQLWESLLEKVKQYIGGEGEFKRMAQNYSDENLTYERTRFLKTMPTIQKRNEYIKLHLLIAGGNANNLMLE